MGKLCIKKLPEHGRRGLRATIVSESPNTSERTIGDRLHVRMYSCDIPSVTRRVDMSSPNMQIRKTDTHQEGSRSQTRTFHRCYEISIMIVVNEGAEEKCVWWLALLSILTVGLSSFTKILGLKHESLNTRLAKYFCFLFLTYFYLEIPVAQNFSAPVVETCVAVGFCQGHDQSSSIKDKMDAESWAWNQTIEGQR